MPCITIRIAWAGFIFPGTSWTPFLRRDQSCYDIRMGTPVWRTRRRWRRPGFWTRRERTTSATHQVN